MCGIGFDFGYNPNDQQICLQIFGMDVLLFILASNALSLSPTSVAFHNHIVYALTKFRCKSVCLAARCVSEFSERMRKFVIQLKNITIVHICHVKYVEQKRLKKLPKVPWHLQ